MNYEEAAEATVTRAEALREIARHDLGEPDPVALFFQEVGDKAEYTGEEVLSWLGY
ncbi:hypothetical protein J2W35_004924 [Variovorax boronicumulans]|uniref:hypothetical protein n=1 Tax=Variovorax boronicumulans TaxID=436515 RepID=UPI002785FB53|nr:hypothetical protein [Variovorax boronicumulans]MDQ0084555.1 hypothetical protein [Variovorax boronicumulans]